MSVTYELISAVTKVFRNFNFLIDCEKVERLVAYTSQKMKFASRAIIIYRLKMYPLPSFYHFVHTNINKTAMKMNIALLVVQAC